MGARRDPIVESSENTGPAARPVGREIALAFIAVARIDDVPTDRGLCVRIDGIEVGLFRVADEIHAMENACPHAGEPLSEGELDGPIVTCLAHGWKFDVRTGFPPEDADGFPIPRFAVRIEGESIEVDLQQALNFPANPRGSSLPGKPSDS